MDKAIIRALKTPYNSDYCSLAGCEHSPISTLYKMQAAMLKFVLLLAASFLLGQGVLGQVAFQAQFSSEYVSAPATGPHLFDNVILNNGNMYNGSTGKFTAPAAATYHFSAQVFTNGKQRVMVDIRRNATPVARMALNTTQTGDSESVSTGVTLALAANDQVWVETANPLYPGNYWGLMHTFFFGFKVCGC